MRYPVLFFHPYAFLQPSFTNVFPIQYIPDTYNAQGKLSFPERPNWSITYGVRWVVPHSITVNSISLCSHDEDKWLWCYCHLPNNAIYKFNWFEFLPHDCRIELVPSSSRCNGLTSHATSSLADCATILSRIKSIEPDVLNQNPWDESPR